MSYFFYPVKISHGLATLCFLLGAVVFIFNLQHLSLNFPLCCLSLFSHALPSLSHPLLSAGYTNFLFCPLLMLLPCPSMLQFWHPAGTDAVGIRSGLSPPCFYLILACSYLAGLSSQGCNRDISGGCLCLHHLSCPILPLFSWLCTDAVCSPQLQLCHIGFIHLLLLSSDKLLPQPLCMRTGHLQELRHILGRVWWVPCHLPGHFTLDIFLYVLTEVAHREE